MEGKKEEIAGGWESKAVREREKKARMEKKTSLEEKWTRLRWVTDFIDENKDKWEMWRRETEKDTGENLESWDNKDREKKIQDIRTRMNESEIEDH